MNFKSSSHFRLTTLIFGLLACLQAQISCLAQTPPTISVIGNQRTFPNLATRPIPFTISDAQTPADQLLVTAISANTALVPATNVVLAGVGSNRTITLIPVGIKGTNQITITVQDQDGLTTTETFQLIIADFTDIGANLVTLDDSSVAWGDYDNDGNLDLLLTGQNTAVPFGDGGETAVIYHNNGDGTFTDIGATNLLGVIGGGAVWGDYNNDGRLDILLAGWYNYSSQGATLSERVYRNDGTNGFTQVQDYFDIGVGGGSESELIGNPIWGDFNNDGRLDTIYPSWPGSNLSYNSGGDNFTNSGISPSPVPAGEVASADYNNDGTLDFVSGYGWTSTWQETDLYQNNGGGTNFTVSTNTFPGVTDGTLAWEDYNNDGNFDLAMVGYGENGLFAGNGHGGFTNTMSLPGGSRAGIAWGDFDNDGIPDMVISSSSGTRILRNNGDGTFTDMGISLPAAGNGGVAVGDFNNDGCLDIAITGGGVTKIFRNDGAMPDVPPIAPANLIATSTVNSVVFSWSPTVSAKQSGGFSYNLRVGTTPGGIDILGPMADPATGTRRIPALGNSGLSLNHYLVGFKPGTYYWSVQTIDHSFVGSPFATEQSFTLNLPAISQQPVNQSNVLGGPVSFVVGASGTAPFSYQWYFNGTAMADNGRITGSATTNLSLSAIQASDVGNYYVVVGNACGSITSQVATLSITSPLITAQPQNQDALTNSTVTLSVTATGPPPLSYQWMFDGTNIPNATSATLTLSRVLVNQSGDYSVLVSNGYGDMLSSNAILSIAPSSIWYVNVNGTDPIPPYDSWDTAATNIQEAVDAAYDGGVVLVTNGVYSTGGEKVNGSLLTNRVVINKPITLESVNGPNSTFILGAQIPGPQYSYQYDAIRCVYMTNGATLIGFTLANGGTLNNGTGNDNDGAGIWCTTINNAVISNCVLEANSAAYLGGGAFQGTMLNCTVLGNTAEYGGGVANAMVSKSLLVSNAASSPSVGTEGGGAYNSTIFSSAIADNSAGYQGGGVYGGTLVNCTVTRNSAYSAGGGVANCNPTNCIIYNNKIFSSNPNYTNWYSFPHPANYCCTTPRPPVGSGNITNDPVLASISHISLNSPCRSAGNPVVTNGTDIDGNPWGNPPSIGCSEIPSTGDYGNLAVSISVPFTNQAPGYPLTFQTFTTGPVYTTVWNFGDGTIVTNAATISHTWPSVGTYLVTLTGYNDSYPTGIITTQTITVAVPTVYYVDLNDQNPVPPYSHWSTAATNIQDAVNLAIPGSLVLVTNQTVLVNNLDAGYATNYVALYQYGGMSIQGHPYRVGITNPITVQSVNGPSTTYIDGFNYYSTSAGVYITNGAILSGFTITNGYNYGNTAGGVSAASTNAVITNCVITECHGPSGGAYSGTFYNCAFIANSASGSYGGATLLSVLNNCLITNNSAEYGGGVCGGILNNCIITSNSATDGGGAFANLSYPIILNNCIISNNIAQDGGGVYNPPVNETAAQLSKICTLTNCIVTCNSASQAGGGAVAAELNNCLISSNLSQNFGGGVECGLLNNCTLIGNNAANGGGADGIFFSDNLRVLSNCTLVGNSAGSIYGGGGAGANGFNLNECMISQNIATNQGGGVAGCTLDNCLIISNTAAANPARFYGGPAYGGGAYSSILTNCILADNVSVTNGGGAYQSTLVNCTVTANTASFGAGVLDCQAVNCVIYYNSGGDFYPNTTQYPLKYCCTSIPVTNGFQNITSAPLFVNLATGDYHLQSSSPCINSGNNAYVSSAADLDGNPRIVGGTADIGAYEYQTPTSVISYAYLQQYGLPTDGSEDFKDLDGTAFNVDQDWIAGLNPTNPASVLAMLTPITTNTATGVTVTWQSISGIPYLLQRSTNLVSQPPFSTVQNNIIGQTNTTTYTDISATNNVPYFYRVGVTAP